MVRILTVTNWYPPHHYGGYELSCFDVMARLAERGHDVRILCGDERVPGAAEPDGTHEQLVHRELQLYLREGALYRPPMRERIAIERHNHYALERHLGEHQPDVVSVWHMGAMSLGLLRRLADRGVPTVYAVCDDWLTYGHLLDAWSRPFAANALRRAAGRVVEAATGLPTSLRDPGDSTAFCFVSGSARERSVAHGPWLCSRSTVVYSGIDRSDFPPLDAVADRAWRWRLLYTGRFDARKGIETLVRSLPLLPPQATLECYGKGGADEQARLAKLAADLGVTERVAFGTLDRHELATRYADADVFVFPSEWEEPFGLVPIEAMACGTPVVATGTGGSREFLRDGYNCVVFTPGDPRALASAIDRLHDDRDLRRRVVQGGLHTAEELDVERLADTFEKWHVAAAAQFAGGRPANRHLDLPDPSATGRSCRAVTPGQTGDRSRGVCGVTRVRVGIVSWNTAPLLDRCLAALPAALEGVDATVVVVDNASSDNSAEVATRYQNVRVVRNAENEGYARAMNQALAGPDADVLVALNPDTEPAPRSLATLAHRLMTDPGVGLVVPRLSNPNGTLQHSVFRFPSPRQAATVLLTPRRVLGGPVGARWWADGHAPHDRATDIDWAIGAVHVIRVSALDGEKPYDERWFMYVEDVDLCWRLAQRGWRRRLEPDVRVVHVGNASGAQAWGDTRTDQWMAATYDWYARTFGRSAMRRWAVVNATAVSLHLAGALPGALLGSRRRRLRARELARSLPRQVGALVTGKYTAREVA